MSAKDAPGEVNTNNIFGSPNISTASDDDFDEEVDQEAKKAAEEQRKRETVDIDGVPIAEKDIQFKAANIRAKKMNYFVNVEGAEERAKAEAKRKEAEKRAAEKKAEEEKQAAERKAKEAELDAEKKIAEEKKHIEEVKAYAEKQKAKVAREKKHDENSERREKLYNIFWKGKHKFITLGVPILIIAAIVLLIVCVIVPANEEAEYSEKLAEEAQMIEEFNNRPFEKAYNALNADEDLKNALINYNYEEVDGIYEKHLKTLEDDVDIAKLYMDKADRILQYHPDDVERIIHEAELGYSYAPNDAVVVSLMRNFYSFAGDDEKAVEMAEKMNMILESQSQENTDDTGDSSDEDNEMHGGDYEAI